QCLVRGREIHFDMNDDISRQFHNIRSKYRWRIIKTIGRNECRCGCGRDFEGLSAELKRAFRKIIEFEKVRRAAKRTAHITCICRGGEIEKPKTDFQSTGFARFNA